MSIQYKVLDTYKNAHDEEIWDVVWQDDNTILTASLDDNVKSWQYNPESNQISQKSILVDHNNSTPHNLGVNSIDVSPELGVIITRSLDSFIRSFNNKYELVKQLDCSPVSSWNVKFFNSGQYLATGSMTGHVHIIRAKDMEPCITIETKLNFVVGIAISPDDKLLACSSMDGKVVIFELKFVEKEKDESEQLESMQIDENNPESDGTSNKKDDKSLENMDIKHSIRFEFEAHKQPIRSLCFSFDNKNIITGSDDKLIRVHSLEGKNRTLLDTMCGHGGWILSLRRSPDNRHIVSSSGDGKIKIWDLLTRECINTFDNHNGNKCWAAAYNSDGSRLASVSSDKSLVVYECPKMVM